MGIVRQKKGTWRDETGVLLSALAWWGIGNGFVWLLAMFTKYEGVSHWSLVLKSWVGCAVGKGGGESLKWSNVVEPKGSIGIFILKRCNSRMTLLGGVCVKVWFCFVLGVLDLMVVNKKELAKYE
jgi:hypothetical protein